MAELEHERERAERESGTLRGEQEGLEQSDEYRQGRGIAELKRQVAEHARTVSQCESDLARERDEGRRHQDAAKQARAREVHAARLRGRAHRDLELGVERMDGPTILDLPHEAVGSLLSTWLEDRAEAIAIVRRKLEEHRLATQRRDDTAAARGRASERLDAAEERLRNAHKQSQACEASWWGSVETWRAGAVQLVPYLLPFEDPLRAREQVAQARTQAREPLVEQRTELIARGKVLDAEIDAVQTELAQWRAGREPEPEAPRGRRDRAGVKGAPVWRLLEFDEGLGARQRDGIEAALLDCGILDAWMTPDGTLHLDPEFADVLVVVSESPEVRGTALPLVADSTLAPQRARPVSALLASISWVERDAHASEPAGGLVIGEDGSWRTPHLVGRTAPETAKFIGAASREAAREAKIDTLERLREELTQQRAVCLDAVEAQDARLTSCDEELGRFPETEVLLKARRDARDAQNWVGERKGDLHEASEGLREATAVARRSEDTLVRLAAEHVVPTSSEGLDTADAQVRRISRELEGFRRACGEAEHAEQVASDADASAQKATARLGRAEASARERQLAHEQLSTKLQTLEASIGKPFRELLGRLEKIRSRLRSIGRRSEELQERDKQLARQIGSFSAKRLESQKNRDGALSVRKEAHETYVELCSEDIVGDADLSVAVELDALETLTAQLESARHVRADPAIGSDPTDATLSGRAAKVHKWQHDATQQLAGRISVMFEPQAGSWSVLRARQDGIVVSGGELQGRLRHGRERAVAELDQKQQELFEEILTGSLREHLKARLYSARALVDRINELLGEVRSAAGGVGVSLAWEIDPDLPEAPQLRRAKQLLLQDSPVSDGRAELDAFLRSRVEQVRADEKDTGDWRERLERMLDYRDWHRFSVRVHHTRFGEQPRLLASRNVSLSAGEKTIVMVLPLLVAVVAHYEPANEEPPCESPRLLLMDELFPKLDFNNKRQIMGLLPRLELDGVFTSDKDRCEYDTLDGIAIHLFQKLPDDKTTTTRMVWNGRTLIVTSDVESLP